MSGLLDGHIHAGNLNRDVDQRVECRIETNHRLDQQLITRALHRFRLIDYSLPLLYFEQKLDRQIDQRTTSADPCEQRNEDAKREPAFPHAGQTPTNAMEQAIERTGVEPDVTQGNMAAEGAE